MLRLKKRVCKPLGWLNLKHANSGLRAGMSIERTNMHKSHTTSRASKVSKEKAKLNHSPVIQHYNIAGSCICDSLWCDSLGKWTDIQTLQRAESTRGSRCSSRCFWAMLQYTPHEKDISYLALDILSHSLSCSASFSLSVFLFSLHILACSHMPTLWVMAVAHEVSTFYHHFNRAGSDAAKALDPVSIHHTKRWNQSSLGPSTLSALICTGYPLILAHSHISLPPLPVYWSLMSFKRHGNQKEKRGMTIFCS